MSGFTLPSGATWGPEIERTLGAVSDPIWIFDVEVRRVVWANLGALHFWRAPDLDALRGRDFSENSSMHEAQRLSAHRAQLQAGEVGVDRWSLFPDEGTQVTVDVLLAPIRMPDGRLAMLHRARGDRARSEAEALRGVEALRHTDVMVTVCTLEGRLLLENTAAQRRYDFSSKAPPDVVAARFASAEQARRARARLERGVPYSEEIEAITPSGPSWHALDIHISTDPVTDAPCLIITERDINERKVHEQALEESRLELELMVETRTRELALERDQFEQVFDTASALIVVIDAAGFIIRANTWAHSVLHTSNLVGRPAFEACGFPSPEQVDAWIRADEAPPQAIEAIVAPNGGSREVHILWTPRLSRRPDGTSLLFLAGLDITELRQIETRLQVADRLATIGTLAAGIAHDLNNPLAYVTSNLEMIIEELAAPQSDDLSGLARDCLDGVRRATRIVKQLKTFAGGSGDEPGLADVASVLEFSARMAHNHVKHHAKVDVRCPQGLLAAIDQSKLGQVMLNLIVHAANRIEAGEVSRHRIQIDGHAADRDWVTVTVRDDGRGFSADELRRIFDPYTAPRTPPRGMSGLGLAVSHRLVTEAGGRVEVTSEEHQGTRVQLWLPRPRPHTTSDFAVPIMPRRSAPGPARASGPGSAPRILLVDDEPKLRAVVRRVLRAYHIEEAENGRQALELLEANAYDLVLCDVMMPEMTGVELFETLLERRPQQTERFVFMSGGAFTPETTQFLDASAQPVIEKPFRMQRLRELVAEALRSHPRAG